MDSYRYWRNSSCYAGLETSWCHMKKYVDKRDKYTCSETTYSKKGKKTRYFYLFCDICGVRHPDVCVNDLCKEEGFPEGDYCWNCQISMLKQGFVRKDKKKKKA